MLTEEEWARIDRLDAEYTASIVAAFAPGGPIDRAVEEIFWRELDRLLSEWRGCE